MGTTSVGAVKRDAGAASSYLTDTEIQDIIDFASGSHSRSVAHVLRTAAAKVLTKGGSVTVGKYSEDFASTASSFMEAAKLWLKIAVFPGFGGGLSKSDKRTREADTDRNAAKIKTNQFTNQESNIPDENTVD